MDNIQKIRQVLNKATEIERHAIKGKVMGQMIPETPWIAEIGDAHYLLDEIETGLNHYANEDHWSIDIGRNETDPDTWIYDGGQSLPWTEARKALGKE